MLIIGGGLVGFVLGGILGARRGACFLAMVGCLVGAVATFAPML